tara:strand:- start:415 stop:696 length:282 start_codon:yes stop_codon:yes gene_type:complete
MYDICLRKVPTISINCAFSDHEGEKVILNVDTGKYFKLNSIGSKVFNLMTEDKNIETIIATIAKDFDCNFETIKEDILAFIKHCEDLSLVRLN